MRYFPIFVDLKERLVVVVGGGEEALRKVRLILKTEARITVVAPSLHEELAGETRVQWVSEAFAPQLLDGASLVYSAEPKFNAEVSAAARERGIPINAVDDAGLSSFIVPSIVDRDPVVVAIGTEGTAPVLAVGLRARIDAMLPHGLGRLARAAETLRPKVADALPKGVRRRSFWQRFFFGPARESFLTGDSLTFQAAVDKLFANGAAPVVGRVCFVNGGIADPELLTLKGQRKLQEADVIVFDPAVGAGVLELARRDAVRMPAGSTSFTELSILQVEEALAGRQVVRLYSGIFPAEELIAIAAEGIAVEPVPGVETKPVAQVLPFSQREPDWRMAS